MTEPMIPIGPVDPLFSQVGGHATFDKLVRHFYQGIEHDEVLRPMYPDDDMEGAVWRLTAFLEQYWGGPTTYSEQRGHPRLRMRHMPFRVNPDARDRWLHHMRTALDELALPPMHEEALWDHMQRAAHAMVNTFEDSLGAAPTSATIAPGPEHPGPTSP